MYGCSLWSFTARQPIRGRCYGEHRPLFTFMSGPIIPAYSVAAIADMIASAPQNPAALLMTDVLHPQFRSKSDNAARKKRFVRAGFLGSALLVTLVVGWPLVQNYRANWGIVVPGKIYRSAQMGPSVLRWKLRENHINLILFLSHDDVSDSDVQSEKKIAGDHQVQFLNFPMYGDGVAPPEMYTEALIALCDGVRNGKTVLVHCHSGAQRTGGVIAVYRMLVEKMPPAQALAEMEHYGHDPRKNLTLVPFINEHIGQWAEALVKDGVIDRVPDPLPKLTPTP